MRKSPVDNGYEGFGFRAGTFAEPNGRQPGSLDGDRLISRHESERESLMERWSELAAHWGIELSYFDIQGQRREADGETVGRIAAALAGSGQPPAAGGPEARPVEPAFQGDGRRVWVLAVQLYGVRSRRNWGHGDFTDLAELLRIVAGLGGAGVGLNPLHAQFYDRPECSGSPYSPNSRQFLNPLYVDVEAIEEFQLDRVANLAQGIERLRAAELVDYAAVAALKLGALRDAYLSFASSGSAVRRADFEAYRRERGRPLECFAASESASRTISRSIFGLARGLAKADG